MLKNLLSLLILLFAFSAKSQNWSILPELPFEKITGIHACKSIQGLTVTTLKNGIFHSDDNGNTWTKTLSADSVLSLSVINDTVLFAGVKTRVFKSTNGGKSWTPYHLYDYYAFDAPSDIVMHPSGKLIAGTGSVWDIQGNLKGEGILVSSDTGKTWSPSSNGISKERPLIQSLAMMTDGTLLAGLYDEDAGLKGKHGIYRSVNAGQTWERVTFNINFPNGSYFKDDLLRTTQVFDISVAGDTILASISGVYTNFAYNFTVKTTLESVKKENTIWILHWVKDTIPSQGAYYELTLNYFRDSQNREWASVSPSSSGTDNDVYTGKLSLNKSWKKMDVPGNALGPYMFTEDGEGNLYTAAYFSGDNIFTLQNVTTGLKEKSANAAFSVYPNPALNTIEITRNRASDAELLFFTLQGEEVYRKTLLPVTSQPVTPPSQLKGLYLLQLSDNTGSETIKVHFE